MGGVQPSSGSGDRPRRLSVEGIGATLLIIAAALSNYFDRNIRRGATIPLYCAAAFSVAGLILTAKAAPIMLSLRTPTKSRRGRARLQ